LEIRRNEEVIMTIQVSQRDGIVFLQTIRPGIVTTLGLHPIEARNLRDALNDMPLDHVPFFFNTDGSTVNTPAYPPKIPVIDLSDHDQNAREVSEL
jgi:hypothetical protein